MRQDFSTLTYSVLKASEGGIGGTAAAARAKAEGATKVVRMPSIYVGETCIVVTAPESVHRTLHRVLF